MYKKVSSHVGLSISVILFLGAWLSAKAYADWSNKWEATLAGARNEGQVTIYMSSYKEFIEAFRTRYPNIRVITVTERPAGVVARIMAERRAGKYIPDLTIMGPAAIMLPHKAGVLSPVKPALILPEVLDESRWYGNKHGYFDPEQSYIFLYATRPGGFLHYNVNLVNPKEFRSYWDFLSPKWKGKIVSLDPTETGSGQPLTFIYHTPELGPDYIRKLYGGMDVALSRDVTQMIDWLGKGKFALCMLCKNIQVAKEQGLPVNSFTGHPWKEGTYIAAGGDSLALLDRAPHPNAAKLFVNWLFSREGQIIMQKLSARRGATPTNSRRVDIPKDDIPLEERLVEGRTYFDVDQPQFADPIPLLRFTAEIIRAGKQGR